MSAEQQTRKRYFNEIVDLAWEPYQRLIDNTEKIRKIVASLEAGESIDPKKLKKMAGSIDYWADKLLGVNWTLVQHPEMAICAHLELEAFISTVEKTKAQAQGGAA